MIRVGIAQDNYHTRARFGHCRPEGVEWVQERFVPLYNRCTSRIRSLSGLTRAAAWVWPGGDYDLLHTFNTLVLNRKPWIIGVESILPRTWSPALNRKLLWLAARDECRAVLPSCNNSLRHIAFRNEGHPALEQVLDKACVVYPGLPDRPEYFRTNMEREKTDGLRLLFIGRMFFHKGGDIAIRAFETLRARGCPVEMTVVSSMNTHTWLMEVAPGAPAEYEARMRAAGIVHHRRLPNEEVRILMAQTDVLLVPTLDDAGGQAVLEAMATGVVPVATAIRALPEYIEDGVNGILLPVATTNEGRLDLQCTSPEEIEEMLVDALLYLCDKKSCLMTMGQAARSAFIQRFSYDALAKTLVKIYHDALA